MDPWWMRASVAFVWLATGAAVLHPHFREVGGPYLARLGIPAWTMLAACAGEVVLGLWLLLRPQGRLLLWLQVALVTGFTATLAALDPALLVHPMGVLTKNVPLLAVAGTVRIVEANGWNARAAWLLRAGIAAIWLTEGIFPKVFFQAPGELAIVAGSGLVSVDPATFLRWMGAAEAASGLGVLALSGRPLAWLLAAQAVALVALPAMVCAQDPLLWVHPFGPLTKNVPILAGTLTLAWRCWSSS